MASEQLIWALTDGRPGSDNQTIAVAQSLGEFENKRIEFGPSADLPNFLLGTSDLGVLTKLDKPWPDVVIAAGRRLARVARMIKKDAPKTKIIQLMWPGIGSKNFDLIFAPEHDALKAQPNLIITNGPPNLMTTEVLKASFDKWQNRIPVDSKPAIAVLIGNITIEESRKLISILNNIPHGYLMISTSRRTSPEVTQALENNVSLERYFYKWTPDSENPYLGFIALADFIIVSEDSISMCSEAVTTGKPTYIFPVSTTEKHKRFTKSLLSSGKARLFESEKLENYNYEPLNTLATIVQKIKAS